MSSEDGGPAFPLQLTVASGMGGIIELKEKNQNAGMSLRDWFAGQALAGMLRGIGAPPEAMAQDAYLLADAILAARQPRKEETP